MKRLIESQQTLDHEIQAYNKKAKRPIDLQDNNDPVELESILDKITLSESNHHRRTGKSSKEHATIKAAIADVLLLLDGFDLKDKKPKEMTEEDEI
ncbi:hypothetical protein D5018_17770 [Parashewanella curva]|uniref:Uncharacterized protein n=1 Tax=Parashewanella curva TaxID=2338552 RepID=A0A3L8PSI7_9GAMM|nr:hypothetical protein [Parashewanella curva]RLV58355.1 hypothetical protein D5018_17770 [Parashewanella curva]